MKNAIHLDNDLIQCKGDAINAMPKRFGVLIIDNGNEEEVGTRDAAEAFAKVYAKLNSLQEKYGIKIEAAITTDGVLSGNIIWHIILHILGIDAEKEILYAFDIHDLEDKICGIKSVALYNDPSTCETFLLFNDDNGNEEEVITQETAEAFAKVYIKLNSLQEKYGVKIEAAITTDGINIESSKDNLVYRIIIPKHELDEVVDITIPIEIALDTAIKKMND